MTSVQWVDVAGAANMRDLGGLPAAGGAVLRAGRLIRSDSLQALTDADVRYLVDEVGVRSVADLRTGVEVRSEGPGPLTREPLVTITHLSLFPETDLPPEDPAAPVVLPWQVRDLSLSDTERRQGAASVYRRYLLERPDSILAALRMIAGTDGATIVHCAAGKDRTGVVVAFALAEVGVPADEIVADYARSAERIEAIIGNLAARSTYRGDMDVSEAASRHAPRAETMRTVLAMLDDEFGGVPAWLRSHGWTDDDADRLRRALLEA